MPVIGTLPASGYAWPPSAAFSLSLTWSARNCFIALATRILNCSFTFCVNEPSYTRFVSALIHSSSGSRN
ncbi:Uncharacterised protein [Mycobacteroides abscessus]|nr:Uncharacterised protein [Mycobacteroides abscessus]